MKTGYHQLVNCVEINSFLKHAAEGLITLCNFLLSPPRLNVAARHHEKIRFALILDWLFVQ